jgi:hypothetical protein
LKLLNWLGSAPWRWCRPWATFCAMVRIASPIARYPLASIAINCSGMGGGGGGRSSLPLPLAPLDERRLWGICRICNNE